LPKPRIILAPGPTFERDSRHTMKRLKIRTLRMVMWLLGQLSLRGAQRLGAVIGRVLWWTNGRTRQTTQINIDLAFPEQTPEQRRRLAGASLVETGRLLMEVPLMWERPVSQCFDMIREIEGQPLLDEALASEQGLVLLAPHLGNWELAGLFFSSRFSMAALYSPPNVPEMEAYMSEVRGRVGSELVRADRRGVLRLFTILREGGVVGILPDQNPDEASGGVYAPFFGIDILSMKLVSRMISKTGARALVTYAERLEDGHGFRLVIDEVDERLYESDIDTSVTGLNATVEKVVRRIPEQYQWEYKRFKRRRPGSPHPYDPGRVIKGST